jgi:hypothetical protein
MNFYSNPDGPAWEQKPFWLAFLFRILGGLRGTQQKVQNLDQMQL